MSRMIVTAAKVNVSAAPMWNSRRCRRSTAIAERHGAIGVTRDLLEARPLRLQGEIIGHRKSELVGRRVGVDPRELAGLRIWERPEEHGINGAENRRRRANAEADRNDDGQRQHGDAQQTSESDAHGSFGRRWPAAVRRSGGRCRPSDRAPHPGPLAAAGGERG